MVDSILKPKTRIKMGIDIDVHNEVWNEKIPSYQEIIEKVLEEIFSELKFDKYVKHAEISVVLAMDESVHKLNQEFRGKGSTTNVLSFPAEEIDPKNFKKIKTHDGFLMLGDVVFAFETVYNESQGSGKSFEEHFSHLLIHGILHLLGYDHRTDEGAEEMEDIEAAIMNKLNFDNPYND